MHGCNAAKPLIFPLQQPQHSCPFHLLTRVRLYLYQLSRRPPHGRTPSPAPWPAARRLPWVDTKPTLLGILSSGACGGAPWLASAGPGWVISCPSQSRGLAPQAWGDAQSTLPTGGEPIPAVCFGEDHFLPARASERSVYQTVTNGWESLRVQVGWGPRGKGRSQGSC